MSNIPDEEVALQLASLHGRLSERKNSDVPTKEVDSAMYGAERLLGVDDVDE